MKHIAISCDHAGFDLKERVSQELISKGYEVKDFGPKTADRMDYPDAIHPLAKAVNDNDFEFGIIICGSGNGVAMTANKYANVRAGLSWTAEIAELTRLHNNCECTLIASKIHF